MKKLLYHLAAALLGVLLLSSCSQADEKGLLSFGLDLNEAATLKSGDNGTDVMAALVTIQDANGQLIFDKENLELIRFGDGYVTRSDTGVDVINIDIHVF